MRLTLRTLLAYLDDILEPSQTKEIGQKVSDSNFAVTLINRIREVLRRRRLTAPEVEGPGMGLDPNTVSEYLDNTLAPDKVADVERVCLESDVHLAEMAACHQILTLVLGEPVEISTQCRERMYALGPVGSDQKLDAESAADGNSSKQSVQHSAPSTQFPSGPISGRNGKSFSEGIPEYLKRRPLWRRLVPYAVLGIVAAVWLTLIVLDPAMFPGWGDLRDQAATSTDHLDGVRPDEEPDGAALADATGDIGPLFQTESGEEADGGRDLAGMTPLAEDDEDLDEGEQVASVPRPGDLSLDPPPPADEPELDPDAPVRAEPDADKTEDETPDVVAARPDGERVPKEPFPVPDPDKDDLSNLRERVPEEDGRPAEQAPPLQYVSRDGILLHYDDQQQDWYALPRRALVHAGEQLVTPEPFDSQFELEKGALHVTVWAGSAVDYLGPNPAALFGFRVRQGRLLLETKGEADADQRAVEPVVLAVSAGGDLWRLELLSPNTRCGFEITPRQPNQFEQPVAENPFSGRFHVAAGSVRISDGKDHVRILSGPAVLELPWPEDDVDLDTDLPLPPLTDAERIPEWLTGPPARMSPSVRRYATFFEREFEIDESVSFSVPAMARDRNPRTAELAAKCLALTQSYEPLVQALAQSEHEEVRVAAIHGIRDWLGTKEGRGERLQEAIEKVFHRDNVATVYQLLWGFNESDARDPIVSRQLVDWLEHEHIAVRELAFYHIQRLTGRKFDYRPLLPAAQRRPAVNRWLNHLDKEGALIRSE